MPEMNSFEVLQVEADLQKKGIKHYSMQPGNDCIWVSEPRGSFCLHYYYIFRDGKIVDIQID